MSSRPAARIRLEARNRCHGRTEEPIRRTHLPEGLSATASVIPENFVATEIVELSHAPAYASAAMFHVLISFVLSFRAYLRTQADNQVEILALRHQIVVVRRPRSSPCRDGFETTS